MGILAGQFIREKLEDPSTNYIFAFYGYRD